MKEKDTPRSAWLPILAFLALGPQASAQTQTALAWLSRHEGELTRASDQLWETPEPAHHETFTAMFLEDELARAGFSVTRGIADLPTAFVASYGSGAPVIGIVALIDALPGLSQARGVTLREPLASKNAGHGCGHNLIAAADLGAALAIQSAMKAHAISGTLRLYGAPAEEIYHGGVFMVRAGAFDDVDALLFWHPSSITLAMGRSGLAMDSLRYVFHGRPTDATDAAPKGRNALHASIELTRQIDAAKSGWSESVVVNYVVLEGGLVPSVVPERSTLWVFAHGRDRTEVDELRDDITALAERASRETGTTVAVQRLASTRRWLINGRLAALVHRLLEEETAPAATIEERAFAAALRAPFADEATPPVFEGVLPLDLGSEPVPISDDTAEASWVAPRVGFLVASFPAGVPSHTWQWTSAATSSLAHKGMLRAAKVLTRAGLELLTNPVELGAVRREFLEATRGEKYRSPLPPGSGPFDFLAPPTNVAR